MDTNSDRKVSLAEFDRFCDERRAQLRDVFLSIDVNGDGSVTSEELRCGVERAGLKMSDEQLRSVFESLDADKNGVLDLAEFESTLLHLPDVNPAAAFDTFVHRTFVDDAEGSHTVPKDLEPVPRRMGKEHQVGDNRGVTFTTAVAAKLLSGGAAGAVSRTATAPIDRIKTILQMGQIPTPGISASTAYAATGTIATTNSKTVAGVAGNASGGFRGAGYATHSAAAAAQVRPQAASMSASTSAPAGRISVMDAVKAVYREGGARAFFRGNGANVVKVMPETATKLVAFDVLKRQLAADPGNATVGERFAAGGLAGAAAQTLVYPLEIVKTRMAVSSPGSAYSSIQGTVAAVVAGEGVGGLFRGLAPSLVGIFPYAGIDLMVNSLFKEALIESYQTRGVEPGVIELLSCGMASSTAAMIMTYPLNLIRTRLQASGMPGAPEYKGPMECFGRIVKEEGASGLYRGVVPNLAKVLPATSISYAVYDLLSRREQ